ncbi:hypothetical protein GYMLUDRAFT_582848 [Collybiopsis luxurians FD-317 M1]|uniref:Uncharacterized protein n=1 Tax=Collybiopsis luxurians FD-317 M1 TaxID=944289 RepID=A0A0D0BCK3_9AGAR|nr:hypothetical protein GYMLUDRAFT_582848 [Collybiopsis luxurians FD-317 M1]
MLRSVSTGTKWHPDKLTGSRKSYKAVHGKLQSRAKPSIPCHVYVYTFTTVRCDDVVIEIQRKMNVKNTSGLLKSDDYYDNFFSKPPENAKKTPPQHGLEYDRSKSLKKSRTLSSPTSNKPQRTRATYPEGATNSTHQTFSKLSEKQCPIGISTHMYAVNKQETSSL